MTRHVSKGHESQEDSLWLRIDPQQKDEMEQNIIDKIREHKLGLLLEELCAQIKTNAKLIQLSNSTWLNASMIIRIEYCQEQHWHVYVMGKKHPLDLSSEEEKAISRYVRLHSNAIE